MVVRPLVQIHCFDVTGHTLSNIRLSRKRWMAVVRPLFGRTCRRRSPVLSIADRLHAAVYWKISCTDACTVQSGATGVWSHDSELTLALWHGRLQFAWSVIPVSLPIPQLRRYCLYVTANVTVFMPTLPSSRYCRRYCLYVTANVTVFTLLPTLPSVPPTPPSPSSSPLGVVGRSSTTSLLAPARPQRPRYAVRPPQFALNAPRVSRLIWHKPPGHCRVKCVISGGGADGRNLAVWQSPGVLSGGGGGGLCGDGGGSYGVREPSVAARLRLAAAALYCPYGRGVHTEQRKTKIVKEGGETSLTESLNAWKM